MFESTELAAAVDILRRVAAHGVGSDAGAGSAGVDPAGGCEELALLGELRNISEVLTASCLREVDLRGSTEITHGLKVRTWFTTAGRCSPATSSRLLSLGRILARFPVLADACRAGEIGVDHVEVVRRACNPRIADALAELDGQLCDLARNYRVRDFTRAVARIVAMLDLDGPTPDCRDTDTLAAVADLNGGVHLDGSFTGENAVHLTHALNTEMGRQRRLARADATAGIAMPSASVLRARALMALIAAGHTAGGGGGAPASRDDAIVVIDIDRPDPSSHDSHSVDSHSVDSLADSPRSEGPRGGGPVVRTLDGDPIDPVTAAVLLCDAHLSPLVCDHHGRPLHYGRTRRFATTHQIRALAVRDGGCVFPGCDAPPSQCHAHHEPAWHAGGRTDIDHMALLCAHHHGRIHGPDWQLHPAPADSPHHHVLTNLRTGQTFHTGGDPPVPIRRHPRSPDP